MGKHKCMPCGYVYDPAKGDPEHGVPPGTPWEGVLTDWTCPVCGGAKAMFEISPGASSHSKVVSISMLARQETIFVLDMCGSTALAARDEKMAYHLKQRLQQIAGPILKSESVRTTKSTGDGCLATFALPSQGVSAAKRILDALAKRNRRTQNAPIAVRIALHAGKTYAMEEALMDMHGADLNLAFRIEDVQAAGMRRRVADFPAEDRILCSDVFLEHCAAEIGNADLGAVYCGMADLKGIPRPVDIFLIPWRTA